MPTVSERDALSAMGGAGGFRVLTNSDSPFVVKGILIGARTTDAGITVSGKQYNSGHSQATDISGYEIDSSGNYDPLWLLGATILIPAGVIKIILGGTT